jgi:hypothetical protein
MVTVTLTKPIQALRPAVAGWFGVLFALTARRTRGPVRAFPASIPINWAPHAVM